MTHTATIQITARSTPFAGDVEGSPEFYETLGRIVCLWGRFEVALTSNLIVIRNLPDAASIQRPLPVSWKQKVSLWKEAFDVIPALHELKASAREFIVKANDVAHDRHVLQHSHWAGFESQQPLTAKFRSVREQKDTLSFLSYSVALDQLRDTLIKIDSLNTRLLPFTFKICSLQKPFAAGRS